jgi:hypothetical protein
MLLTNDIKMNYSDFPLLFIIFAKNILKYHFALKILNH